MGSETSKLSNQLFEQALSGHQDFFKTVQKLADAAKKSENEILPTLVYDKESPLHAKDNLLHAACRFSKSTGGFHKKNAQAGCTFANKFKIIKYLVDKRCFDINEPSASSGMRPLDYACFLEGISILRNNLPNTIEHPCTKLFSFMLNSAPSIQTPSPAPILLVIQWFFTLTRPSVIA